MNHGFEIKRDYIGKRQKNHGVGTNCVFGRRKKMMGFGQTMDMKLEFKLVQVMQGNAEK